LSKFGSSQPVRRLEDTRFITGHGRYIDDTAPEGALRGYVLRSPLAHGRITTLDVSDAREAPGVAMVLTAAGYPAPGSEERIKGSVVDNRDGTKGRRRCARSLPTRMCAMLGSRGLHRGRNSGAGARCGGMIELDIDDLPVKLDIAPGGAGAA
jgi:carbon-monoxide dehydrogenase large subunit